LGYQLVWVLVDSEKGKYRLCGLAAVRSALGLTVENFSGEKVKNLADQRHHSILVHPHLKNPGWLLMPMD